MSAPFAKRRRQLLQQLKRTQLDCLLVTHPANWYYLTGFSGESGMLLVTADGTTLLTDGRFTTQAKEEAPGVRVELQKGSLYDLAGEWLRQRKLRSIGYDPTQWTVAQSKAL